MVIMGYVQVRLKYPDVSQPAHKTDSSDESVKNVPILLFDIPVFISSVCAHIFSKIMNSPNISF
jgi:hypothetical protein